MDCVVHGILQARILEWVAVSFFKESSQSRDGTQVSHMQADSLPAEPPGKLFLSDGLFALGATNLAREP